MGYDVFMFYAEITDSYSLETEEKFIQDGMYAPDVNPLPEGLWDGKLLHPLIQKNDVLRLISSLYAYY